MIVYRDINSVVLFNIIILCVCGSTVFSGCSRSTCITRVTNGTIIASTIAPCMPDALIPNELPYVRCAFVVLDDNGRPCMSICMNGWMYTPTNRFYPATRDRTIVVNA
jgi:hypothetical protein